MKIGLKSFSPEQAGALRIILASLVLLPISVAQLKNLQKKDLKSLLIAGFIGSFFPAFLFMKAETQINSSLAGMLNSLTPVFTLIVGLFFHKTVFRWIQVVGLSLGLAGASGLMLMNSLIRYASAVAASSVTYIIPVFAIMWGVSDGEKVTLLHLVCMAIVLAGVYLISLKSRKPTLVQTRW
jgi:drug/metabolite transporter (DMT)-like permease